MTLKQRVIRAGGWSVAGHGLSQIIRLASTLIMTRLLVPEMFGVMAIATMVQVTIWLLCDIGLTQNIVQSARGDEPDFLDTAWVIGIVRGILVWFVAILLSVGLYVANLRGYFPIGSVYASPELPLIIVVSSFAAVISSFQSTKMATAYRTFSQRRLIQIELVSQITGVTVMVLLATATRSIWALVAGGLATSLTTMTLSHLWITGHTNRFRWENNALSELIHFGKWVLVSSAVYVLASNGDRILLGGLLDAHLLGLYSIATLIIGAIEGGLSRLFNAVSLPALSEILRDQPSRLREVYYKLRLPSDLLLLFAAGFLFTAGQALIDLLYDPRYSEAGRMLEILAWSLFVARYGVAHQIYLAAGTPRYLTVINLVRFLSLYALIPLLHGIGGIPAVIWGVALHSLTTLPFVFYFNSKLGVNDYRRETIVLLAIPVGYAFGIGVTLILGR